jgi:hypothetical protein
LRKVPCCDEPIAAIISRPAEHADLPDRKPLLDGACDSASSGLHESFARYARRDSEPVRLPHLPATQQLGSVRHAPPISAAAGSKSLFAFFLQKKKNNFNFSHPPPRLRMDCPYA